MAIVAVFPLGFQGVLQSMLLTQPLRTSSLTNQSKQMIMKGPQLESGKVLLAFISRLACCSVNPSPSPTAGSKRSRNGTISRSKRTTVPSSVVDEDVVCPGAKQLPCFLESSGAGCRAATFSLPCLDLAERKNKFSVVSSLNESKSSHQTQPNKAQSDSTVAENLARPMRYNKLDITQASNTAHKNFCSTFQSMVDERLRRTALTLLQRSMVLSKTEGMDEATAKAHAGTIRSLLPSKSGDHAQPIEITASVTNWVISPPKEGDSTAASATTNKTSAGKATIAQPVVFEAVLDLSILGSATSNISSNGKTTLRFSVPGTVSAVFSHFTSRIETVQIQLDPEELIKALDSKCREVVHKAVQEAYAQIALVLVLEQGKAVAVTATKQQETEGPQLIDNDDTEMNSTTSNADLDRKMMPPPPPRPPTSRTMRPKRVTSLVVAGTDRPTKRARFASPSHRLHAAITA